MPAPLLSGQLSEPHMFGITCILNSSSSFKYQ